jgi:hypothetical protein
MKKNFKKQQNKTQPVTTAEKMLLHMSRYIIPESFQFLSFIVPEERHRQDVLKT